MSRNEENNKIRNILADTSARLLSELRNCPSVIGILIEVDQARVFGDSKKTFHFEIRMPKKEVVIRESLTPEHNLNENNNGREEFDPDIDAHG